ncbi:MAG: hypothetical protein HFI82_04190 [Eubacterium sp.]|jgi:spore coat polysaccharide biosynthesis predicted glycosyltransferase SpsG|nr:hypothetical protein [Eubacterium sp.]
MIAVCIEASHKRGMGHIFRALNFTKYLAEKKEPFVILINEDPASLKILSERNLPYEVIHFQDTESNWEAELIKKYRVDIWLNDKFESSAALCRHVKQQGILLAAIDDAGEGAGFVDLHFAGMLFGKKESEIPGKHVFCGFEYNILNPEIEKYQRNRSEAKNVIVCLGGSDTYGATVLAVNILKNYGYAADIVVGPNFRHEKELADAIDSRYRVFHTVPSLVEKFSHYDIAITGGGVTCIEANAAGLPCIIIASEIHEITTGKYMERLGGAVFAGYYKELREEAFRLENLDISRMSERGKKAVSLKGSENIYRKLREYQ